MTAIEAIKKIKVALGMQKFEEVAELIDGTKIHVSGEFAIGEQLHVVTESGEFVPAPEGSHTTTEGQVITVDAGGAIVSIEPVATEEIEAEKEEEKMEEEKVEVAVEVAPEMVQQVIDAITPLVEQVKSIETELSKLKASFSKFSNEPAGEPARNNFKAVAEERQSLIDKRMDALVAIRNKKK